MPFVAPKRSLAGLDLDGMARCVTLAADIAFVIDEDGLICDVSVSTDQLTIDAVNEWLGKTWLAVVHVDSQSKVLALTARASSLAANGSKALGKGKSSGKPVASDGSADADTVSGPAPLRWRQLNHVLGGEPLPLQILCEPIGDKGRLLVMGRDIRPVAALQQKLIEAQQSLERDYWQLRQAETRYRLLFDQSSEAILVVDADLDRVLDVNPAASRLWTAAQRRTLDGLLDKMLDEAALREARTALARVRSTGRTEELLVSDSRGESDWRMQVSMLREDGQRSLLVRLNLLPAPAGRLINGQIALDGQARTADRSASDPDDDAFIPGQTDARTLRRLVDLAPDGFVVTDPFGNVLSANQAFADLVQMNDAGAALGESIDRWLGRSGIDLGAMLSTLKQYGSVRLFATTLRGEQGTTVEVEISAVMLPDARKSCIGFTVRHVGRRLSAGSTGERAVPRSVEQLTKLVGRMPLKDLVRESTDLIEQLCIEAALELTRDNRASAAELLGLSRQSLYVKLRRYGLGDLVQEP